MANCKMLFIKGLLVKIPTESKIILLPIVKLTKSEILINHSLSMEAGWAQIETEHLEEIRSNRGHLRKIQEKS